MDRFVMEAPRPLPLPKLQYSNTANASFARRLKALSGLTPYEYIAKAWTSEPSRF